MSLRLGRNFFLQPTLKLAKELLGKFVVRRYRGREIAGKIVEVEVYKGPQDRAAHSFGGKITKRNKIVYEEGGHIYIYLCYGMYWQFNIVSYLKGKPECILLRALEPVIDNNYLGNQKLASLKNKRKSSSSLDIYHLANGPGKLCRYLKLDKSFYGEDLTKSKRIWIEDRGLRYRSAEIIATRRVGIDYAGPYWSRKKWRFYVKGNRFISRS